MTSSLRIALVFLAAFDCSAGTSRADDLPRSLEVQAKLKSVEKYLGFDDPKTTLQEALDQLAKHCNVTFVVNRKAFAAADVKDVTNTFLFESESLPGFNGDLAFMLRRLLERLPTKEGTFIIRDGVIEITTRTAVAREFYRGRPTGVPLPPLVHADIANVPLTTALRDLTRAHGGNIVVDARAAKEAGTTVTAELTNVPLDTAVALLADMSGLTTVDVGNVIYVTTKDNARALQQEQERRRLNGQKKTDPTK